MGIYCYYSPFRYATTDAGPEGQGSPTGPVEHISQPLVDISTTLKNVIWH